MSLCAICRVLAAFVALCLTLSLSTAARAQSAEDASLAKEVMKQGGEHEKAGRLDDALAAYRIAHDLLNDPHTGASLCRALIATGKLVEGREVCLAVIKMPSKKMEPSAHRKGREEAIELAAGLEERIGSVQIRITGLAKGAKAVVAIDGDEVEDVSSPIPVDPGPHRVEVTAKGHEDAGVDVTVKEGEAAEVAVKMRRTGAPDATEEAGGLHWLFWVGVVGTGVGLVAGTATGIFVVTEKNRLESECEFPTLCAPEYESELDLAVTLAHVSTASFVLAGLGVGAMVGGWFLSPSEDEIGVIVGPAGIAVTGRF